jgi:hypothetical protein
MHTIIDFPNEILLEIGKHLDPRALQNISWTCKSLRHSFRDPSMVCQILGFCGENNPLLGLSKHIGWTLREELLITIDKVTKQRDSAAEMKREQERKAGRDYHHMLGVWGDKQRTPWALDHLLYPVWKKAKKDWRYFVALGNILKLFVPETEKNLALGK